jgi:hypothetical protein
MSDKSNQLQRIERRIVISWKLLGGYWFFPVRYDLPIVNELAFSKT